METETTNNNSTEDMHGLKGLAQNLQECSNTDTLD